MKKKKNIAGTAYWAVLIAGSILLILYCLMQSVPKNLVFRYVTIWVLILLAGAIGVFFLPYGKEGKKLDEIGISSSNVGKEQSCLKNLKTQTS